MVDRHGRKVYVYDADGNHQSELGFNLHSSNTYSTGITCDGPYLYVVDSFYDYVYVYTTAGDFQSRHRLPRNNQTVHGIAWNGSYFYIADQHNAKMYVYDANGTQQSDRSFNLHNENNNPMCIAWDGSYLHVADLGRTVYVYDADGNHVG